MAIRPYPRINFVKVFCRLNHCIVCSTSRVDCGSCRLPGGQPVLLHRVGAVHHTREPDRQEDWTVGGPHPAMKRAPGRLKLSPHGLPASSILASCHRVGHPDGRERQRPPPPPMRNATWSPAKMVEHLCVGSRATTLEVGGPVRPRTNDWDRQGSEGGVFSAS